MFTTVVKKETYKIFFPYRWGTNWAQNVLDFDHIGKILDLFRGKKFLFLSTVETCHGKGQLLGLDH